MPINKQQEQTKRSSVGQTARKIWESQDIKAWKQECNEADERLHKDEALRRRSDNTSGERRKRRNTETPKHRNTMSVRCSVFRRTKWEREHAGKKRAPIVALSIILMKIAANFIVAFEWQGYFDRYFCFRYRYVRVCACIYAGMCVHLKRLLYVCVCFWIFRFHIYVNTHNVETSDNDANLRSKYAAAATTTTNTYICLLKRTCM